MRLTDDGVGMHVGFLPGYAASHGCIRMPSAAAEMFFNHVKVGHAGDGRRIESLGYRRLRKRLSAVWVTSCLKVSRSVGKKKCLTSVSPPPASAR